MPSEEAKSQGVSRRTAAARLAAVTVVGVAGLPMSAMAQSRRNKVPTPPAAPPAPSTDQPTEPSTPPAQTPAQQPAAPQAPAQQPAQQQPQPAEPEAPPADGPTKPSPLDKVIVPGREGGYTLRFNVHVAGFQKVQRDRITKVPLEFTAATLVFPVLVGSASHATDIERPDQVEGKLSFNDKVVNTTAEFSSEKDCGTRLGLWKMGAAKGGELDLNVTIPMRTWATTFDESIAARAVWPKQWSRTPLSCFNEASQYGVDFNSRTVQDVVKQWTGGKDPKSISPLTLAKFLTGKVLETVRITGSGIANTRIGTLEGVEVDNRSASAALATGRANTFAATCALCAVYLAAGLPARTVIGYDIKAKKADDRFLDKDEGSNKLVSWVEFCLRDEGANKDAWIPVDFDRLQSKSSRVPAMDKPWEYFGTNKDLEYVLPFAFQFLPPMKGVVSHGSPGFWGWFTTPTINDQAEQSIKLDAITTPKRGGGGRR